MEAKSKQEEPANAIVSMASDAALRRDTEHDRLAKKFKILSEFVRVPILSKMLGISSNAIYSQMRKGTFPVSHRRAGNVVLVRFSDFVDWYLVDQDSPVKSPSVTKLNQPPEFFTTSEPSACDDNGFHLFTRAETRDERYQRIKQEVIAGMKAKRRGHNF